jgi:DNA-binding NtrC family response regulator
MLGCNDHDGWKNRIRSSTFTGRREILLVEDEYYDADDLKRTLHGAGAAVVGPFSTVAKAREAVDRGGFHCALIDLNPNGDDRLADSRLFDREGECFAIATGHGLNSIPERFSDVPRIEKPFDPRALLDVVRQLGCARDG